METILSEEDIKRLKYLRVLEQNRINYHKRKALKNVEPKKVGRPKKDVTEFKDLLTKQRHVGRPRKERND